MKMTLLEIVENVISIAPFFITVLALVAIISAFLDRSKNRKIRELEERLREEEKRSGEVKKK